MSTDEALTKLSELMKATENNEDCFTINIACEVLLAVYDDKARGIGVPEALLATLLYDFCQTIIAYHDKEASR